MASPSSGFKNWLSRPDNPPKPADPAEPEPAREPMPATELTIAEGSDVREGAIRASLPKTITKPLTSYTPGGTYIPLSGGMRGWYENSAVPANELRNHYAYADAVESSAFKKTILERIESFNRRAAERYKVDLWAKHSDPNQHAGPPTERAYCTDLSVRGACLRVRRQFPIGQPLVLALLHSSKEGGNRPPLTVLSVIVRNTRPAGGSAQSPRYYAGMEFVDISIQSKEVVAGLLAGALAIVPRT